ncbi:MAG: hypothetical protein HY314_06705 [Acidobacteria bacterium]|nr:hypothetical protein [Acidobacteriota bacterium]
MRNFIVLRSAIGILKANSTIGVVTSLDPVGRSKWEIRNGLGRLIRLDEPDTNGNLGTITAPTQPTNYSYNVLDKLIQVEGGGRMGDAAAAVYLLVM